MIVLFCTLAAIIALLDFILLMFTELIDAVLGLFPKIRKQRNKRRNERR